MKPTLFLIRGLPGSSKSTYARMLLKEGTVQAHFEADMYFEHVTTGEYFFDATKLGLAHAWCYEMTTQALDEGKSVAVANTFTTHREMRDYVDYAKTYGYDLQVIVRTGNYGSIHGVPEEAMEKMRKRWQD